MPVTVRLPTALRSYAGDQPTLEVDGKTVGDVVASLAADHPDLRRHLLDDQGAIRSFVNLYLNQQDVRELDNADTAVSDGDTIIVVPAVAGGAA